jgi:FAD/FMN-containing dehydrogenase
MATCCATKPPATAGVDFGTGIRRAPAAVLRPRSVDDIIRIAAYANKTGRKIAMRGQGHSLYGQAQAEGGIIVDSSTLNAIRAQGDDLLDAQSGVLWGDAARVAFSRTRMPPVMVDALMLSVGGTLSVGGIGETSFREGCQVDHVSELDVYGSRRSRHLLAGPQRRPFRMILAALANAGSSSGASSLPAPEYVVLRTLNYPDLQTLVSSRAAWCG